MRLSHVLMLIVLIGLQGCATQQCDKVQAYQQIVAGEPLDVPADLSEPPMRGESPEVDPGAPTRRADGGCLELPPPFEPEEKPS